jgi:hypothetical protein
MPIDKFSMKDLASEGHLLKEKRNDFQKELLNSVYGLKSYINSIKEDFKRLKMQKGAKILQIKEEIQRKKIEVDKLID